MECETTGDQINQKVDVNKIGMDFIQFYFEKFTKSPDELITSGLFKPHSRIKYKGNTFKGETLINFIKQTGLNCTIHINDIQILDSGGRRIDILISAKIKKNMVIHNFNQYFTLANIKDQWFIHNSLLNIE